jgi:hypothetical protein
MVQSQRSCRIFKTLPINFHANYLTKFISPREFEVVALNKTNKDYFCWKMSALNISGKEIINYIVSQNTDEVFMFVLNWFIFKSILLFQIPFYVKI